MQGEEMRDANRGCGEPRRDLNRAAKWIWLLLLVLAASPCPAADLTIEQVRDKLAAATCEHPADFSGKSLDNLDLSGLDFKRANLSGANLFGAKLDGAKLSGANRRRACSGRSSPRALMFLRPRDPRSKAPISRVLALLRG